MIKVLFISLHNSARTHIAEALLRELGGERFDAHSAGLEPSRINPLVIEVLKEENIDISQHTTQSAFELFQAGKLYHYVISMCDDSRGEKCPVFPGQTTRLHWSFEDPSLIEGNDAEKLIRTRAIKERIKNEVLAFIASVNALK